MASELVITKKAIDQFFEKKMEPIFDKMFEYQEEMLDKVNSGNTEGVPVSYLDDRKDYNVEEMITTGKWPYDEVVDRFPFVEKNEDDMQTVYEYIWILHHFTSGDDYREEDNYIITKIVKTMKSKHGDAVRWRVPMSLDYRNSNLIGFVWNKNDEFKIIPTYTKIDDYGSVAPQFVVGNASDEFEPKHWLKVVDNNGIVFLSEEIKNKINSLIAENPDAEHHTIEIKKFRYIVQVSLDTKSVKAWAEFDGHVLMV